MINFALEEVNTTRSAWKNAGCQQTFSTASNSLVFHLFPVEIKRKLLSNAFQLGRE